MDECLLCGGPLPYWSENANFELCAKCTWGLGLEIKVGLEKFEAYLTKWAAFRQYEEAWARYGVR